MRIKSNFLVLILIALLGVACSTPKEIIYFQDMNPGSIAEVHKLTPIKMQSGDKISIVVNCKDEALSTLFNLKRPEGQSTSKIELGYTVDTHGDIDFPVLGKVNIMGLTREEVAEKIKGELISKNLLKDPVVTVEFLNLSVVVLGEVTAPGRYSIDKDQVTVLDALGMARDLTIYGKRDCVKVMREEDGVQKTYELNLLSGKDVYDSPAYYLQQNDVVYVEPNSTKARQSTVNGNNVRSVSFWLSLASFLTTILVLFVR